MPADSIKVIANNRNAFHEYFIEDSYEAGIVLSGTEVKSIRQGKINLKDSYAIIKDSEVILRTLHRNASQVTADSQGRIVLPVSLIEHAKITKGAVVVGCGTYGEIWAEEEYERTVKTEDLESIRAALESFGL